MVAHSELAKFTGRSAIAVMLMMIFIILCILSFNGTLKVREKVYKDIHILSDFSPSVISRSKAFEERIPFATCVLAKYLFVWNGDSFPNWENFYIASHLEKTGHIEIEFSFQDYWNYGECHAEIVKHYDYFDKKRHNVENNLETIISALNEVNKNWLFDESITPDRLAKQYEKVLRKIGMEDEKSEFSLFKIHASTIIDMIRREDKEHSKVARWIVYEKSPFTGSSIGGGNDFQLKDEESTKYEIEEFLFRQKMLSTFLISLPQLPDEKEIWSAINIHARDLLGASTVESELRLPFLSVGISYRSFLFVSSIVLVFFLAVFATAQAEFTKYQKSLLHREKLLVFPRLTSRLNPLELDFQFSSDSIGRVVWASFLIVPLSILSFATLFRYDFSSIDRIANSGSHFFSRYQSLEATVFDIVNIFCLLGGLIIVKNILSGDGRSNHIPYRHLAIFLIFANFLALLFIFSQPFGGFNFEIFNIYYEKTHFWDNLLFSPRIFIYLLYFIIWFSFCLNKISGNAFEFFLVSGLAINGTIALSLL